MHPVNNCFDWILVLANYMPAQAAANMTKEKFLRFFKETLIKLCVSFRAKREIS